MSKNKTSKLSAGLNIAMKITTHEYDQTVKFYREIIGLREINVDSPSVVFDFCDKRLWLDRVDHLSQAEMWLEIQTDDVEAAAAYLDSQGVVRRDEIEPLPEGFQGIWISNPAGIIHLISQE